MQGSALAGWLLQSLFMYVVIVVANKWKIISLKRRDVTSRKRRCLLRKEIINNPKLWIAAGYSN